MWDVNADKWVPQEGSDVAGMVNPSYEGLTLSWYTVDQILESGEQVKAVLYRQSNEVTLCICDFNLEVFMSFLNEQWDKWLLLKSIDYETEIQSPYPENSLRWKLDWIRENGRKFIKDNKIICTFSQTDSPVSYSSLYTKGNDINIQMLSQLTNDSKIVWVYQHPTPNLTYHTVFALENKDETSN